jgi:hypothetical protein
LGGFKNPPYFHPGLVVDAAQPRPIDSTLTPTIDFCWRIFGAVTMTKRKDSSELIGAILPDQIYRTTLSPAIFGYGTQRTRDLIREQKLPLPAPLTPGSRFEFWTGAQILQHRADMRKLAEEKAKADRARPPQEQPLALQPKTKKLKLRPSGRGR